MVFDQSTTLEKIRALNEKIRLLRLLESEAAQVIDNLQNILDREVRDLNADGTQKLEPDGTPKMKIIVPKDLQTREIIVAARRNTIYDKMIVDATAILAKKV